MTYFNTQVEHVYNAEEGQGLTEDQSVFRPIVCVLWAELVAE